MTRHWFASSLVLSTLLATASFAQVFTDLEPSDQQVSQLRPGFKREGIDPAAARGRIVVAPAPVQLVDDSASSTRSFLPKWLDWRRNKSESQSHAKQNSNRAVPGRQANKSGNVPRSDADASPPDPAALQNGALPGLGGSPLPRANRPPSSSGATSGTGATAANGRPRGTQTPAQSPDSSSALSGMRMAAREPATAPATSSGTNATLPVRSSPPHRTAPNISADELRRELSGTFPSPKTTSGPNSGPSAQVADTTDGDAAGSVPDAADKEMPVPLPTTAPTTGKLSAAAKAASPFQSESSTIETGSSTGSTKNSSAGTRHARSAYGRSSSLNIPPSNPTPPQTTRGQEVFGEVTGSDPNVLASSQTPVLTTDIRGPKQILVGRESTYRVRLQNQSDVPAEGIVATVRIPSGAEVMNTTATQGSVQPGSDPQSAGLLQWQLSHLDRRASETLEIRLVPRENKPLELGVSWTLAPVASRAVVEVQEAKLNLEITGPNEVLFDKPQTFKLTLTNPGTGPAENVRIDLMPPGDGQEKVSSHQLGTLAAGASQTVDVELTAREAGKLSVRALAAADGGLKSEAAKEIFCRKPELAVDWRGPATKYANTMATYFIRVRNPGTAPADDITVRATLPEGAEFTSASEGQSYDAARREVAWRLGTLNPGDDNYMELKCVLKSAGKNTLNMSATNASGKLADAKTAETNVIAIADLKLDVSDPRGPVAVGTQAVYEIHVRNRGANIAKEINVVALFSEGIEPEQAEGAMYSISDGRVSFKPIDELPAGREVVLKIRAHAVQPGTHVFRAEVLCRDLDTKLAAEETTHFYADDVAPGNSQPKNDSANLGSTFAPSTK